MRLHGLPEKIAMDKSGANKAAIDDINDGLENKIVVRQVKYLNNIGKRSFIHALLSRASMGEDGVHLNRRWTPWQKMLAAAA